MAEAALGALGALSSILQIANSLVSSIRELRRSIKVARGAPTEIRAFCNEATFLSTLIRTFYKLARDAPEPAQPKELKKRDRLLAYVRQQCVIVQGGVTKLVNKFIDTHGTGGRDSSIRVITVWARVLWVIRRPDMEELRLSMTDTKLNLSLLTNLLMWEEARRQPNNEDKIRDLEIQLREATESAKQARRELRDYRENHTHFSVNNQSQQKLDELLFSTREIEKHVVRAVRAEARRQRREQQEERNMSPPTPVMGHPGEAEGGGNLPPSPPDSPREIYIGRPRPKSPGPGLRPWVASARARGERVDVGNLRKVGWKYWPSALSPDNTPET